jgi:hypothetical protein
MPTSRSSRKPPQTTHIRDYPERVTITRTHHPFEGKTLEVLRHAIRQECLFFVLILPDGSKSLIPADWTDYAPASPLRVSDNHLIGSLEDLLQLRFLTDALLQRAATSATQSVLQQESHAATESELHRYPGSGDVLVGSTERRAQADRNRNPRTLNDQRSPKRQSIGGGQ